MKPMRTEKKISNKYPFVFKHILDGEGDPPPAAPPAALPPALDLSKIDLDFNDETDAPVVISKKELANLMKRNREKFQASHAETLSQIQKLTDSLTVTQQERERIDGAVTQIKSEYTTKLVQKDTELERNRTELDQLKAQLEKETKFWRTQFETSTIDSETTKACNEAGVLFPQQMQDMLTTRLALQEKVTEKGEKTGKFYTVVKSADGEGKEIFIPVLDYIKGLDAAGTHPNMFKHNMKGGLNMGGDGKPGSPVKLPKTAEEMAEYMADPRKQEQIFGQTINK
jgi:hypothetical protein